MPPSSVAIRATAPDSILPPRQLARPALQNPLPPAPARLRNLLPGTHVTGAASGAFRSVRIALTAKPVHPLRGGGETRVFETVDARGNSSVPSDGPERPLACCSRTENA